MNSALLFVDEPFGIFPVRRMKLSLLSGVFVVMVAGCVTAPRPSDTRVSASYVGDRGQFAFDEIVVSLPLAGANSPRQNLH